jgi:rRNA processing protein Gar1
MNKGPHTDPHLNSWIWLSRTRDAVFAARRKELHRYDISARQASVMFVIQALGDKATPSEISRWLLREPHSVSEFLQRMEKDIWPVEIDKGQMNQVITNLVINADEAMPEGGILHVEAKNTVITQRSSLPLPKGNYVEVIIKDSGVGMPKDILDKIYEPYFTTKQKGSGLGLATTYSIIKKHGGHITVESTPGIGTTFHIYIPASEKPIPAGKETVAEARGIGAGRVLVMDDEDMIRLLLSRMLKGTGYEVKLTEDGAEAIQKYTEAKKSGICLSC